MGAPLGPRLMVRKGRAGEGAADERARKPGTRRERDVADPSHSFQKWVLEERIVL